jgi:hypothetical protein
MIAEGEAARKLDANPPQHPPNEHRGPGPAYAGRAQPLRRCARHGVGHPGPPFSEPGSPALGREQALDGRHATRRACFGVLPAHLARPAADDGDRTSAGTTPSPWQWQHIGWMTTSQPATSSCSTRARRLSPWQQGQATR